MYNKDEAAHRAMLELLRDRVSREFGPYVFPTQIRRAAAVAESEANQQPVVITHPRSSTARCYQSVADEIAERLVEVRYAA
jgi:cellulose biosynthesis protein BcsQ